MNDKENNKEVSDDTKPSYKINDHGNVVIDTNTDWAMTSDYTISSITNSGVFVNGTTSFSDPIGDQFENIAKRLEAIEERLCIVDDLKAEQAEALKEAHREYKFIEKLILGDNSEDDSKKF